ncbi:isoflavone reductase family protein [Talaromyces pinophilus]|uniref:Isoflavone reductase family protein n=1 Tax=Talaromyces pinophilus TaxID=128442 RepID=A0A0B8MXT5_TALPI|nr:isoflavone reductase family protein [Talaromyces pinophilus]
MATELKSVLVLGATGVIGQYIIRSLIEAQASFDRLAVFTSPSTVEKKAKEIESLEEKGVQVIVGDLTNQENVLKAYEGSDTVISCVGRNMIKAQIDLIRWAEESSPNIKRFFPSEYGTDIEYGPESVFEKPHQAKLAVRNYIKSSIRRVEYTYLVTGPYADLYIAKLSQNPCLGSFDIEEKKATLLGSGDDPISLTTMNNVGKLLVAALRNPTASRNRALRVNSFTTTPKRILAEYERQTGTNWDVSYTSLDDLKKLEKNAWESGDSLAAIYTLRRIWTEGGTIYEFTDNELIGMHPEDLDSLEDAITMAISSNGQEAFRSGDL